MANPTVQFSSTIDGIWLVPMIGLSADTTKQAWIGGSAVGTTASRTVEIAEIAGRREKVSTAGVLHLDEGEITGVLMTRHGLNGDQWLTRLRNLIEEQHKYKIYLSDSRHYFPVELNGLSTTPRQLGGRAYDVTVPYREVV